MSPVLAILALFVLLTACGLFLRVAVIESGRAHRAELDRIHAGTYTE